MMQSMNSLTGAKDLIYFRTLARTNSSPSKTLCLL